MGRHRRRYVLIAADASVKPLLSGGILPDLIVTIDAQPHVRYHFAGVEEDVRHIPAVISPLCHPSVFSLFDTRYLFVTEHPVFRRVLPDRDTREANTLNHRAVSAVVLGAALRMGFVRILLAGFDFSHPGMRCYADRSFFSEYALSRGRRFHPPVMFETQRLRSGADAVLEEYGLEMESVVRSRSSRTGILRWGDGGRPLAGVGTIGAPFSGAVRRVEGQFGDDRGTRLDLQWPSSLSGDEGVTMTLALRSRLLKGTREPAEARARAEEYLRSLP
jgi:hypothetical protein